MNAPATKYVNYDCPNADASDETLACNGGVEIEATWEDGGVGRYGWWMVESVPAHCTNGCALTREQIAHLKRCAERTAGAND